MTTATNQNQNNRMKTITVEMGHRVQTFLNECAAVTIVKSKTGQRAARISYFGRMTRKGRAFIPVELLSLAAGKDAWMREIEFKCRNCEDRHEAKDMECELCPVCLDKAEQENAVLDGKGEA